MNNALTHPPAVIASAFRISNGASSPHLTCPWFAAIIDTTMLRSSLTWMVALAVGGLASCGERFESTEQPTTTSPTGVAGQGGGTAGTGGESAGGAGGGDEPPEGCGPPATRTAEGWCLLADAQNYPECPIGDATHIYWTTASGIWRVDKGGLAAPEQVSSAAGDHECIIIDDGRLWWANKTHNLLHRASKLGLNEQSFTTSGADKPSHLAGDDTHIYWTGTEDSSGMLTGAVARRLKNGTDNVEVLVAGLPTPSGIALDDTHVYWNDDDGVHRCEKAACFAETLTSPLGGSSGGNAVLVLTANAVLWNFADGIGVVDKEGGSPLTLRSGFGLTAGLGLADGIVYFADHTHTGGVYYAALNGSASGTVAAPIDSPRGAVVDDEAVYWVTSPGGDNTGLVLKAPIPPSP